MKFWLSMIVRLIVITIFLILIALTSRMHIFLAIPVMIFSYFGYVILITFLDDWLK